MTQSPPPFAPLLAPGDYFTPFRRGFVAGAPRIERLAPRQAVTLAAGVSGGCSSPWMAFEAWKTFAYSELAQCTSVTTKRAGPDQVMATLAWTGLWWTPAFHHFEELGVDTRTSTLPVAPWEKALALGRLAWMEVFPTTLGPAGTAHEAAIAGLAGAAVSRISNTGALGVVVHVPVSRVEVLAVLAQLGGKRLGEAYTVTADRVMGMSSSGHVSDGKVENSILVGLYGQGLQS